jgi:N-hydroxyarylamine O-acetyltransferase
MTPNQQTWQEPTISRGRSALDLHSYLRRINYSGPLTANLQTLKSIHFNHSLHIPFENLDPLLHKEVKIDMGSIQKKLVTDERGGWCFEQNSLLLEILKSLGFRVKGLAARVRWNIPEEVVTPRGHMLLLIDMEDEKYIADVGFGSLTLTSPLRLVYDLEQATPHETFRFKQIEEGYLLQAKIKNEWRSVYSFSVIEYLPADYNVSNWYLCNHPQSHFLKELIVTKPFKDGRYVIHDNEYKVNYLDGRKERISLESSSQLQKILENIFGIKISLEELTFNIWSYIIGHKSIR